MFKVVIENFLLACQDDPALIEFANHRRMSLHFIITDKNQEFWLAFQDGAVASALGTPPEKADMIVRMTADTFDGIMSGRINGVSAYMTGKLRFSGDTSKGMALQRLIKDMVRLYVQARGHENIDL